MKNPPKSFSPEEAAARLLARRLIDPLTGCWLWTGARDDHGYGVLRYHSTYLRVHQMACAVWNDIAFEAQDYIRHTCDTPACFNPEHLLNGTQQDNMIDCSNKGRARDQSKTHCKRGHPLSGDNLYVSNSRNGRAMRVCRTCRKVRVRLFMREKRDSLLPHTLPGFP